MTQAMGKRKSEKISPPHQDAAVGNPLDKSHNFPVSFGAVGSSFRSTIYDPKSSRSAKDTGTMRIKNKKDHYTRRAPSRRFIRAFIPSSVNISRDLRFKN